MYSIVVGIIAAVVNLVIGFSFQDWQWWLVTLIIVSVSAIGSLNSTK